MREIRLPLPTYAYRFDLLLEFVKRIAYPARMLARGGRLWRFTAGQPLAYRQEGDCIVVSGAGLARRDESRVAESSRRLLGLCRDLSDFYAVARRDEALWRVIEPLVGLPIHSTETVFEALITLIIEQHISWKTALRSQQWLLRRYGAGASIGESAVHDFPRPEQLAGASRADLQPLKITNRRIDLIIETAAAVCSGELELEPMREMPAPQAYASLLALKGVGPWTASNVIGRAGGVYPRLSDNDVALQAAVRRYFRAGGSAKGAQLVRERLARYGEFAGLAGHFVLLRWVMDNYPVPGE